MVPIEIYYLAEKVRRYGTFDYDKESVENGHHYRTTYYIMDNALYDICMKDGEIVSFRYISMS